MSSLRKTQNRMFIASSINVSSRLHTYIYSWAVGKRSSTILRGNAHYWGGFDNYIFVPNYRIPNYRDLFDSLYLNQDPKMGFILDRFTEYHCRIVEQAVITFIKPEINDLTSPVSFTFPNIDIESYTPNALDKAHPISVYTKDGELFNKYDSINIAKRALGVSEIKLTWLVWRNRTDYFLNSPKTKKDLRVFDHVLNTVVNTPENSHQKLLPISGEALESIPSGEVHAIIDNKSDLYGVYSSCSQFAIIRTLFLTSLPLS